jgi:hypothetical protein
MEHSKFSISTYTPGSFTYPDSLSFEYETIKFKESFTANIFPSLHNAHSIAINDKDFYALTDNIQNSNVFKTYYTEEKHKNFVTYLQVDPDYYLINDNLNIYTSKSQSIEYYFYFKLNFNEDNTLYISQKLRNSASEIFLYFNGTDFTFSSQLKTKFNFSIDYANKLMILGLEDYGILTLPPDSAPIFTNDINNLTKYSYIKFINNNQIHSKLSPKDTHLIAYSDKINIGERVPHSPQKLLVDSFKSKNTNILQLKNAETNLNYSSLNNINNFNFKTYTGIHSGNKHNNYDKLFLGFDSNHHEVILKSDQVNYFHIPPNIGDYEKININDLSIISNGAIGGNTPVNSDKIFKRLENYSKTNDNGDIYDQENGEYLCSWLFYNPQDPADSLWLDRYYIPKRITKLNALKQSTYTELSQLVNKPDNYYTTLSAYSIENRIGDIQTGVFDVVSNLTFEPYAYYIYHHIGKTDSKKLIDNYIKNIIIQDFSYYTGVYTTQDGIKTYNFNGEYAYTPLIPLIYEKNFTLQFQINIDNPYNISGYNIIGNFIDNQGIGLVKDDYYSPFIYSFENNQVIVFHCDTKTITHRFTIDNIVKFIIPTYAFSRYFILDETNMLYEINNNNVVINKHQIDANLIINDFYFYNNNIYFLCNNNFYFYIDINTYTYSENIPFQYTPVNKLIIDKNGKVDALYNDGRVDVTSNNNILYVNQNALWKQNYSTPLLSCGDFNEIIHDFIVDEQDNIFVLTNFRVLKIKDEVNVKGSFASINLQTVILGADSTNSIGLSALSAYEGINQFGIFSVDIPTKIGINRYMKNGINKKYIEFYDYRGGSYQFYSFSDDLLYYETSITPIGGENILDFSYPNNIRYNKFNFDNTFKFKVSLQNIYDQGDINIISIPIDISKFERPENLFTFIFNNEMGNVSLFLNSEPIDTYSFDKNKYYFSNNLLNRKLYSAATLYDKETPLSSKLGSEYFISTGFSINRFKIYDFALNYYDILSTLRSIYGTTDVIFPIPIETRTYLDEITGIFKQNKSIRKSEYFNINVYSSLISDTQKQSITQYINEGLLPELSVNKQILNINYI